MSLMRGISTVLLGASLVAGLVLGSTGDVSASCPRNKAAKLETAYAPVMGDYDYKFAWSEGPAGGWNFEPGEQLVFDFAIIPFDPGTGDPTGQTSVWMNSYPQDGTYHTFLFMSFKNEMLEPVGLSYDPDQWNDVRVLLDFDAQEYTISLNGTTADPQAFSEPNMVDYTVMGIDKFYVSTFNTEEDEPEPAWLDSIKLTKRSDAGDEQLFGAGFDASPSFDPSYGTMSYVEPLTRDLADGACLTTTTLRIDKSSQKITVAGRLLPPHPGRDMDVSLFKKKDGEFVPVATKHPTLDSDSRFETTLPRPDNTRKCRVRARFAADDDHRGSIATDTFGC